MFPEAQSPNRWSYTEGENNGFYTPVTFTTPDGFRFTQNGVSRCIDLLSWMALRGASLQTDDGTRLLLDAAGNITVIDTDVWVNPDRDFGQELTSAVSMAQAVREYLWTKVKN